MGKANHTRKSYDDRTPVKGEIDEKDLKRNRSTTISNISKIDSVLQESSGEFSIDKKSSRKPSLKMNANTKLILK